MISLTAIKSFVENRFFCSRANREWHPAFFESKAVTSMETSKYLATFPILVPAKHEIRNRYIVLKIEGKEQVPRNILINALVKASNSISGNCYKEVAPWLTYFEDNIGVVKFNHKQKEVMIRIVEHIRLMDSCHQPMKVTSLGISGTINKARKKYIR